MSSSTKPQYSALAAKAAEEVSSKWKGTTANGGRTKNYIGGEFVDSQADKWLEVNDPVSDPLAFLGAEQLATSARRAQGISMVVLYGYLGSPR
jgi:hypothetical protein